MGVEFSVEINELVLQRIRENAMQSMHTVGEVILEDANRTSPIDTKQMIDSGEVSSRDYDKKVVISYNTVYAVKQHEDTTLKHAPGRRARWLELTVDENAGTYRTIMGMLMRTMN